MSWIDNLPAHIRASVNPLLRLCWMSAMVSISSRSMVLYLRSQILLREKWIIICKSHILQLCLRIGELCHSCVKELRGRFIILQKFLAKSCKSTNSFSKSSIAHHYWDYGWPWTTWGRLSQSLGVCDRVWKIIKSVMHVTLHLILEYWREKSLITMLQFSLPIPLLQF